MGFFNSMKYKIDIICENCNHRENISIPKGIKVNDFLKEKECSKCGLKMLLYPKDVALELDKMFPPYIPPREVLA
jgi:hypothetical protein